MKNFYRFCLSESFIFLSSTKKILARFLLICYFLLYFISCWVFFPTSFLCSLVVLRCDRLLAFVLSFQVMLTLKVYTDSPCIL